MSRICLADDHPVFLAGVAALLYAVPRFEVVGTAGTGPEALALIGRERPDLAILDISMPGLTGIEIAARLTAGRIGTRVLVLSVFEDRHHVQAALDAGVRGYVLKRSAADQLLTAVAAVEQGGVYVDPKAAERLFAPAAQAPCPSGVDLTGLLTAREREVLRAVALGYTIKEVAIQLGITGKSVETYKLRAAEKLKLGSRAKIVRYAMSQGWLGQAEFDDPPDGFTAAGLRPVSPSRL